MNSKKLKEGSAEIVERIRREEEKRGKWK